MLRQDYREKLITNHFRVEVGNLFIKCFEFATDPPMLPELLNRKTRFLGRKFFKQITDTFPYCLVGNQLVYTPMSESKDRIELGVYEHLDPREDQPVTQELKVSLKFKKIIESRELKSSNTEAYNILAQLMRRFQKNIKEFQQLSATKRYAMNLIKNVHENIQAVLGVETYFRFNAAEGYNLSVDYCIKLINNSSVYDYLRKNIHLKEGLADKITNQVVGTNYGNKKLYRISGIDFDMNPSCHFEMREGADPSKRRKVSFAQYYQIVHNIKIMDMNQPLLLVEIKKKRKQQKADVKFQDKQEKSEKQLSNNQIYLIPELCCMTGIPEECQNNYNLKTAITKVSQPKPFERQSHCQKFIQRLTSCNQEYLKEWKLSLNTQEPIKAPFQLLNPGNILMSNQKEINISNENQLDRKIQDQMYQPCQIEKWCAVFQEGDRNMARSFLLTLQNRMQTHGIMNNDPKLFGLHSNTVQEMKSLLDTIPRDVDFILFILQGQKGRGKFYQLIKNYLTKEKPIASQVILQSTIRNSKDCCQVICNKLCNQICAKSGGIPYTIKDLPFSDLPTMLIGIDITHKLKQKSVYSFVSTVDSTFCRYFSAAQILDISSESNKKVHELFDLAIQGFKVKNKNIAPQRIIIFRSSMNTIFNEQMKDEVKRIKECLEKNGCTNCRIHIQGVNNNDKTKFYHEDYSNPNGGTIINSDVVNDPGDFFLIAQRSNQGTCSPILYSQVYSDFQGEELQVLRQKLQLLTYRMTYLFYNFTGAVKIPCILKLAQQQTKFYKNNMDNISNLEVGHLLISEKLAKQFSTFYI